MSEIPCDRALDSTLALLRDGYEFISKGCERHQSDIFQTRLLLQPTLCLRGAEAARIFYDTEKFIRQGAAPKRIQKTLLGEGGVQGLDGAAHQHRKRMFMALMSPERIEWLVELTHQQWRSQVRQWESEQTVVLLNAAQTVLCQAVCAWAAVPLAAAEVSLRTRDLAAMIDGSGAIRPRHWRGRQGRQRSEEWLQQVIKKVRQQVLSPAAESALFTIAWHRDLQGQLLDLKTAAVELLNVLRPTVAIARY
ncbi:MAG: cytochrome P450, partial [Leptolyngbya sp. SIO4C1]|nr:cytochrome P450 [Leptolyngbya sp. SIO4C1]